MGGLFFLCSSVLSRISARLLITDKHLSPQPSVSKPQAMAVSRAEVKIIKRLSNARLLIEDLEGHVSIADQNELEMKAWLTRSGAESGMGSAE